MRPQPSTGTELATREELVADLRDRLERLCAPRLHLLVIVVLAGTTAFLTSAGSLWLGLASMPGRYAMATVAGYLTFIALIRGWIAWQRRSWPDLDIDPGVFDADLPGLASREPPSVAGGRSSGGASSEWGAARPASASRRGGLDLDLDLDELWPIVLALVCALGGLLTIVYVVWSAPILLAEVALDGAVFTAVYRRLRTQDAAHWAATTVRRTWIPAAVLIVFAATAGLAFERIAPDAHSIGGVARALTESR